MTTTMIDLIPQLIGSISEPDPEDAARRWAESGAAILTGRHHGPPLMGSDRVAPLMGLLADRLQHSSGRLGRPLVIDGPALLGERAAYTRHGRQGRISCGGACRLVETSDGTIAVSLAREDDFVLVSAWLQHEAAADAWESVEEHAGRCTTIDLVERGVELGLAVSAVAENSDRSLPAEPLGESVPVQRIEEVTVVDLSSLWAGPLCASLLSAIGARVIKVESTRRPDGARRGPAGFYDLLNAGKESVALDFTDEDDRRRLRRLVESADVVIEGSRPRALEHLGIDARSGRARVWLSITGHGRNQPMRIGYGDDAAVAGGLVARDDDGPLFIADAVADPITGLLGAVAVLDLLRNGGIWLVDLALARSAALAAGSASASAITIADAAPPRHRIPPRRAARLGDHNDAVLSRLGG